MIRLTILLMLVAPLAQAQGGRPCASSLQDCPLRGCAEAGTPEAGANTIRRSAPTGPARATLTIDDFELLQLAANRHFTQGFGILPRDRARLRHLITRNGAGIGERATVQVRAYIVGTPHRRRSDTANCNLVGSANNNIRLHLAGDPYDTVYDSIIAEITATNRPRTWSLTKLRRLQREGRLVLVTGQLFYDSKHVVNNDPDMALSQHPARLSLWELHPVTNLLVCTSVANDCRVSEPHTWEALATYN